MDATPFERRLAERLPRVRERIETAARRGGRELDAVRIVAVTKGHPAGAVQAVLNAGIADVGENRVEELEAKEGAFRDSGVRWHMIGHVQSRKAARVAGLADIVHSVDSLRLAERLSRTAAAQGRRLAALVQVNASGEAAKGGFAAADGTEAVLEAVAQVAALPGLRVQGLMTMAPFTRDEAVLRATFQRVRRLLAAAAGVSGFEARELSMGMSNDYELAVAEGSTMVRLGTALLGERPPVTGTAPLRGRLR